MKFSRYNLILKADEKDEYILFNTLTGNCFKIDADSKNILEENRIDSLDEERLKIYKEKKIVLDENVDEIKWIDYFHNKHKFSSKTFSITVLLTWACNLKCVYCYEGAGEVKSTNMDDDTTNSTIEFIKKQVKNSDAEYVSINLFGGEPLVNFKAGKKILKEIDDFCKKENRVLVSSIVTNGTLIDQETIEVLEKYNCKSVQITLDGLKHIHDQRRMYKNDQGSFEDVINGIKRIQQAKGLPNPVIRINVDKTNTSDVKELLKYLNKEKLSDCRIDFGIVRAGTESCAAYSSNCYSEEELGELLEALWGEARENGFKIDTKPRRKFLFCGLNGDNSYTIAPTGDVYKCWEQVGMEEHIIGKLSKSGRMDDVRFAFYDWMSKNPLDIAECRDCVYLPVCGGGCGAISYEQTGSYHAKGCFKSKGIIEKQILLTYKNKSCGA